MLKRASKFFNGKVIFLMHGKFFNEVIFWNCETLFKKKKANFCQKYDRHWGALE